MKSTIFTLSCICIFIHFAFSQTIHIPADFPNIQAGIDAAEEGDTVLVSPGHYLENLVFTGKNIVLASAYLTTGDESIIAQTIIDGGLFGPTILLKNEETSATEIVGLTIIRGTTMDVTNIFPKGGGIACFGTSPTIRKNVIRLCTTISANGPSLGGIYCNESSAIILENTIDSIFGSFHTQLGGIACHNSNLTIQGNHIQRISGHYAGNSGGIAADSSTLLIIRNTIDSCRFDVAPYTPSIGMVASTATVINNTLLGHVALFHTCEIGLTNNIIIPPPASTYPPIAETLQSSNVTYTALSHNLYTGAEANEGNFDADPMFVDAANFDFHLLENSPCIDAGSPASPFDPDGTIADIGAHYFPQQANEAKEISVSEMIVSPNPTGNRIKVELPTGAIPSAHIQRMDGQDFGLFAIAPDGWVEVGKLPAGMYLVWVKINAKKRAVGKFLKKN